MKQQVEYIVVSWRQVSILLKRCFSQIINILKQTKKGFFDLVCSTGSLEGCESFWFLKELVTKMGSFYGNNVLISLGKASVSLYSARPIGFVISLNAYSASTPTFERHKIKPMEGLSPGWRRRSSTADR